MRISIVKNHAELGRVAAGQVASQLRAKPSLVLGLPTGGTPTPMYQELVRLHRSEGLDFSSSVIFSLDEYFGLSPDHPQSYYRYIRSNLVDLINISKENFHVPTCLTDKSMAAAFCRSYEDLISTFGGLDLAVLGIGGDGHIGFNEPNSPFSSRTRLVALADKTIADNSRFFRSVDDVPKFAVTVGIATIMSARAIMLLASGAGKAEILSKALDGPVGTQVPASVLQTHKNVIIIADEEAASKLKKEPAQVL